MVYFVAWRSALDRMTATSTSALLVANKARTLCSAEEIGHAARVTSHIDLTLA